MDGIGTVAAKKENVLIQGDCAVALLPAFGGKIASIRVKNHELLQKPIAPMQPRTRAVSFDAGDASGWDECLPSVAACTVKTTNGVAEIPDHGDLWRTQWSVVREQRSGNGERWAADGGQGSITLRGECFSLPLALERTVALAETNKGWRLSVDYTLMNTGRTAAPWSWAAHPLFAAEEGDRIELPGSIREMRIEGSGGGRLGKAGNRVTWPLAKLAAGGETDLRAVQAKESEIGDKLFAGPLRADENWIVLHRPKTGVSIRMSFDAGATGYLGLWLCYGGWPERPGAKQMCVAPEPSTAPVDSLAQVGDWSRVLGPGERFSWPVHVDIEVL